MGYLKDCITITYLLLVVTSVHSQEYTLYAHQLTSDIHLDGRIEEEAWATAHSISSFWMSYPFYTLEAHSQTEVKILLSESYLYIGAICHHDTSPHRYVVQSLKRDFSFRENEAFTFFIDAFNDATSGHSFTVNPFGSQSDGLVANGGTRGETQSWDGFLRLIIGGGFSMSSSQKAQPLKK